MKVIKELEGLDKPFCLEMTKWPLGETEDNGNKCLQQVLSTPQEFQNF